MFKSRSLPLLALLCLLAAPAAYADSVAQTLPFSQDWANAGLITANDNWSGVPGIIGYRGDEPHRGDGRPIRRRSRSRPSTRATRPPVSST